MHSGEEKMDNIEELVYRQTCQILSTARTTKYSPITGKVTRALMHFPAGCQTLVEAIVNYKRHQIFPYPPGGVALDDATETFTINQEVLKGDPLEVLIINHDSVNPHTITVTLEIMGDKQ